MGLFFKSGRRQKLVRLYKDLSAKDDISLDVDTLLAKHPKLELTEAILIVGCLDKDMGLEEFDNALKKLGVN